MSSPHPGLSPQEMAELIRRQVGGWPDGWAGWDATRDAHLLLMDEAIKGCPEYPQGKYAERGIVVSVNAKPGLSSGKHLSHGYFPGAWVLVGELRRLGCSLPITFAYLGPLEWDPNLTRLMAPLGVSCLDLRQVEASDPRRPRILAGWESKPYAVLHAPYQEVLYLDADNLPIADPTFLYTTSQYRYYGSVFWPDVPPYDRDQWLPPCVWSNVGLTYRDEVDFETGQFLINKEQCWRELNLAMWMNAHSDYFYQFVFGDKSTFHLAWARLGTNWAIPQRGPGGNQASLFQHDFGGNVLFQHCTRNKPGLSGYPSPGSLLRQAECEAHLARLRDLWHGKLWFNDAPTQEELAWMERLEGQVFTYERKGLGSRPLRLLADGRVGRGLARLEVGWAVFVAGGKPLLVLSSLEDVPTAMLELQPDGSWRGQWLEYERCECSLIPEGKA